MQTLKLENEPPKVGLDQLIASIILVTVFIIGLIFRWFLPPFPHFVPNQIILYGFPNDVDAAWKSFLEQSELINVGRIPDRNHIKEIKGITRNEGGNSKVIRLYQLDKNYDDDNFSLLLNEFYQIQLNNDYPHEDFVIADANYTIRSAAVFGTTGLEQVQGKPSYGWSKSVNLQNICDDLEIGRESYLPEYSFFGEGNPIGLPGDTGGGPLGLPGDTGGGPFGSPGDTGGGSTSTLIPTTPIPTIEFTPEPQMTPFSKVTDLLDQWVFDPAHANWPKLDNERSEVKQYYGNQINVAIFDTVPDYSYDPVTNEFPWCGNNSLVWDGTADLSDHGIFVASLIHAIAPAAHIKLIEVLDDNAHGDLMSLMTALIAYYSDQSDPTNGQGLLNNTVINLSLGIGSPGKLLFMSTASDPSCFENLDECQFSDIIDQIRMQYPKDIDLHALYDITLMLTKAGAAIVAATGNDSLGSVQTTMYEQPPAIFPHVIGVGSSNYLNNRSCFSNIGYTSILAPSGDADDYKSPGINCSDNIQGLCPNGTPCPYRIIGLTTDGFKIWMGTSFSTPIVSGAAALMLEAGCDSQDIENEIITSSIKMGKYTTLIFTGATGQPSYNLYVIDVLDAVKACGANDRN